MIRDHAGGLRLSVASTDLDDWPTADRGKVRLSGDIVLRLDGEWVVRELQATTPRTCHAAHEQRRTTLCIAATDFMPVIVVLEPVQAK